jgi:hypothetical protein
VITSDKRLTKGQLQVKPANDGRRTAARRRRLDKAAAQLRAEGWTPLMPDGTPWTKAGDAR